MKPVRIDFATPSLRRTVNNTAPAWWVLAFWGVALCLGVGVAIVHTRELQRISELQLRHAKAEQAAAPAPERKVSILPAQANAVNAAVLQLNLPWRDMQEAIDAATPKSIALLALEPDPRTRSLRIMAEARSSDDMIAYVEQLKQQPFFASVVLTKHEVNDQDPNHPLRFALDAQWALHGATQ